MINLFNNLNSIQSVKIRDRNNTYYTMFIEAKKSVDIEGYQVTEDIISKINNGSLIDLTHTIIPSTQSSVVIDTIKVEETNVNDENNVNDNENENSQDLEEESETVNVTQSTEDLENKSEVKESESGVFKCEICGNEYASEKGLMMHKSRSHK